MSDYDGLRACDICGEETTGTLCRLCAEQRAIDHDNLLDAMSYDERYYNPVYGYLDDDDEYWMNDDDDNECDYDDAYVSGFDGMFTDEEITFKLTPKARLRLLCWRIERPIMRYTLKARRLIHAVRYRIDRGYRERYDEIPF